VITSSRIEAAELRRLVDRDFGDMVRFVVSRSIGRS